MTIAIVGLGYVGLPLALQFARNGVTVIGLDVDAAKVSAINAGPQLHQAHRGQLDKRAGLCREIACLE
jgi:UDP-N-acetyl-D-mannosaminuronate dehydrogenase